MQVAAFYMSLTDTRYISFFNSGETRLVPAHSHVERLQNKLKVRFSFQADDTFTQTDDVIADNENGRIRMVTAKGIEFTSGPLFDQLYVWYDYIKKR